MFRTRRSYRQTSTKTQRIRKWSAWSDSAPETVGDPGGARRHESEIRALCRSALGGEALEIDGAHAPRLTGLGADHSGRDDADDQRLHDSRFAGVEPFATDPHSMSDRKVVADLEGREVDGRDRRSHVPGAALQSNRSGGLVGGLGRRVGHLAVAHWLVSPYREVAARDR